MWKSRKRAKEESVERKARRRSKQASKVSVKEKEREDRRRCRSFSDKERAEIEELLEVDSDFVASPPNEEDIENEPTNEEDIGGIASVLEVETRMPVKMDMDKDLVDSPVDEFIVIPCDNEDASLGDSVRRFLSETDSLVDEDKEFRLDE
jgi:hypothetical protein